jgi:hypothetical protein
MFLPKRHLLTGTLAGLVAVVLMAVAAPTTMSAQPAPLNAHFAVRPVTRGDIAAYKLPSTTQVSPGFTTVALGEPAYLETQINSAIPASDIAGIVWQLTYKPKGSGAALEDSPLALEVPAFEPADRAVVRIAGRKVLRPDVAGMYVVSATVTAGASGTATVAQTIIGGTYVGKAACTACHSGGLAEVKAPSWSKTAHASIFTEGVNGTNSDHYAANCLGCHTVGYDANAKAVNGGFDDIAAQLKWTFPVPGAGVYNTVPDALKNLGDIQCENCHGPGSQHIKSGGNTVEISVSKASGTCARGHDAPNHHIKNGEWVNSRHAVVTRDPSGAGREGCVGCHTGTGFIDTVNQVPVDTAYNAISCDTCHEPHGQSQGDKPARLVRTVAAVTLKDGTKVSDGGLGTICMNCHQARQNASIYAATTAASSRFGPHHGPQADMLAGTNGYNYGQKIPSSAHSSVVENTCVGCHMQTVAETDPALSHVGGHTFSLSWAGADGKSPVELVGTCQKCHGDKVTSFDFALFDYDGDGQIDGVQTEVQHLLDQLSALLPPNNAAKTALTIDSTWTRAQLEAAYNWQFVTEDKSRGVHNTAYAVGLLKASIKDLKK